MTVQHQPAGARATADLDVIRQSLSILYQPGDVVEIRVLDTPRGTVSGYFNNLDRLAAAAREWSGRAPGVYTTLNPVCPDLLARAMNHVLLKAKHTTSDSQILGRRWLPLDFDPIRPAGISSSDREHSLALERAREARTWLTDFGFPPAILADSGNGAHLLVPIDLPNDEASSELIRACLNALAFQFTDDAVALDLKTGNPARIWKVYGTVAAKGDSTAERPHRTARILETP